MDYSLKWSPRAASQFEEICDVIILQRIQGIMPLFLLKRFKPFPKDGRIKCECGFEFDLSWLRNQIESDIAAIF